MFGNTRVKKWTPSYLRDQNNCPLYWDIFFCQKNAWGGNYFGFEFSECNHIFWRKHYLSVSFFFKSMGGNYSGLCGSLRILCPLTNISWQEEARDFFRPSIIANNEIGVLVFKWQTGNTVQKLNQKLLTFRKNLQKCVISQWKSCNLRSWLHHSSAAVLLFRITSLPKKRHQQSCKVLEFEIRRVDQSIPKLYYHSNHTIIRR